MKKLGREYVTSPKDLAASCWAIDRAMFEAMRMDASLGAALGILCRSVEEQAPGLFCAVSLLDESGARLQRGAAPSLPESYSNVLPHSEAGSRTSSWGTAAFRDEPVIVSNIANEPVSEQYRDLALRHGLHACWSSPVTSRAGKVLGALEIYYREPRGPSPRENELVNWATKLAGIAIERRQTEDALRKQREELEVLFDSAPVMIWYKDRNNRIVRANRPAAEALGMQKHDLEGRSLEELFPAVAARFYREDLEIMQTGEPKLNFRRQLRMPSGERRRVLIDKLPHRDLQGHIIGVLVLMRDITDQLKAQSAQRIAEHRFRTLVEQLPKITYVAANDEAGAWEYVSPQIDTLLGFSPAEWLADPGSWARRLHPDDRDRVLAEVEEIWRTGKPLISEYRMISRDGKTLWFRDEAVVMGGKDGAPRRRQGVMLDITGSRKIEEDLRRTQKHLSATMNNAPVVLFALDKHGTFTLSEGRALKGMGLRPGEAVGRSFFDLYRNSPSALEHARRALSGEEFTAVGRFPDRDMWIETRWTPQRDAQENITGVIGVCTDLTESKRAELELQRSESDYRSMVERAPYGIYRAGPDGRLFSVNPALVEMLGYVSAEDLMEANLAADVFRNPQDHSSLVLQTYDDLDCAEVAWKRKDGTPITVRLRGRAVRGADGAIVYFDSIVEEVTERRELEKQLRQAQKMEAVGRLAGGVAHDFNNLLMVIRGQLEDLAEKIEEGQPARLSIEKARHAAERAASLTRQLLAFGRMQMLQPRIISLNSIVTEMDKLLLPLMGENVELAMNLDPDLAAVKADPGQMEQVILNLAVNARDAMPAGGRLTIETANVTLDEAYARLHPPLFAGDYVMLAVYDTGTGMDKDTQAHIFEPFFTTKAKGKGTGLGLATVYGIVKQSRGYIWVASEPDQGSTFRIYLPRVKEAEEPASDSIPASLPTGSQTVLLTEDEEGVREVAGQFLRKCGYQVLEARNGAEAISIAREHPGPIHVLVTDMVMPGISGADTATSIAGMRPDIRVVFMSGYRDHSELSQAGGMEAQRLQKPFTREAIAHAVRDALKGPAHTAETRQ